MSADKLSEYVAEADHGLSQSKKVGNMEMNLTYRPSSMVAIQEVKEPCDSSYAKAIRKYKPYYYFVLEFKTSEGRDPLYRGKGGHAAFSERLQKLAFHMGEYIYSITGTDTIPLADSYFPNLYGMGGSTQVLLSFLKPQKDEDTKNIEVVIEEIGLGLGRQKFVFTGKDLNDIPDVECK